MKVDRRYLTLLLDHLNFFIIQNRLQWSPCNNAGTLISDHASYSEWEWHLKDKQGHCQEELSGQQSVDSCGLL